ncbi:VIR protein [Plasmodium vivax]|uniref:VIR protein n=1 Tax=Plasmodium vivax TaxID=5855 RepID=A0A1G4E3J7_PLAVI|nr:VIR protein [Plasmodium vivax]
MSENIYDAVSTFSKYEPILEGYFTGSDPHINEWCNSNAESFAKYGVNGKKIICEISIKYLERIKQSQDNHYISNGCKYLYYKIYDKKNDDPEYSDITFKFYNNLLEKYASKETRTFKDSIEKINNDIFCKLENLEKLYDYFDKYKNSKDCNRGSCGCAEKCVELYNTYLSECYINYYSEFCAELHKFAEKFNEYLREKIECNEKVKALPLFNKYSSGVVITITSVALIVIFFSLFILFKFTPFGRHIKSRIRKKKNMGDNVNIKGIPKKHTFESDIIKLEKRLYNISYKNEDYS